MQTWQLFPIVMLLGIGAYVYFMRGKMGKAAAAMYGEAVAKLRGECAAQQRAGETEPICLIALTKSMFKARLFFVGLTNQRLFLAEHAVATRAFERGALQLTVKKKTFADVGNMTATYSSGWEAKVALPGGESHVWRIYDAWGGYEDQARNVDAFLRATGAA